MTDQEILAALRDLGDEDKSVVSDYIVSLQTLTNAGSERARAEHTFMNADDRLREASERHATAATALAARLRGASKAP
jgi:hypothetical protein